MPCHESANEFGKQPVPLSPIHALQSIQYYTLLLTDTSCRRHTTVLKYLLGIYEAVLGPCMKAWCGGLFLLMRIIRSLMNQNYRFRVLLQSVGKVTTPRSSDAWVTDILFNFEINAKSRHQKRPLVAACQLHRIAGPSSVSKR